MQLTQEQKLNVEFLRHSVQTLTEEETKKKLVAVYTQMQYNHSYYKMKIAEAWGIPGFENLG